MRVHFDPDKGSVVEHLRTEGSDSETSHTADVEPPAAAHFTAELEAHGHAIAALTARLSEQSFDSRTGQPKGFALEGDARRHAELELQSRTAARDFTVAQLARAHALAQARAERRAAAAEQVQPDTERTNQAEAIRREQLIAETALDIGSDGKALGRVRATQLVDAELQRERVATRVRASR